MPHHRSVRLFYVLLVLCSKLGFPVTSEGRNTTEDVVLCIGRAPQMRVYNAYDVESVDIGVSFEIMSFTDDIRPLFGGL